MAYQNGTATSPTDLLQKLATFLVANGWTQDASASDASGWRFHAHKGTTYINIRSVVNENSTAANFADKYTTGAFSAWLLYAGDGYSGAADWRSQSGGPRNVTTPANTVGVAMLLPQGAVSGYHFFTDATNDNVVVVVEKSASIFVHCGWGASINKMGTFTGGQYFFASSAGYQAQYDQGGAYAGRAYSAQCPGVFNDPYTGPYSTIFIRADVDAFTGKWITFGATTTGYNHYTGKTGYSCLRANESTDLYSAAPSYGSYLRRLTSQMTGQSLLLPIRFTVARDTIGNSFLGDLPNIFLCNAVAKGFTPATLYSWGTDQYRVFPGPQDHPHMGFAVKQV